MRKITMILSFLIIAFTVTIVNASFNTNSESIYDTNKELVSEIYSDSYHPIRVLLSTPKDFKYLWITSNEDFIIKWNWKEITKGKVVIWYYYKNKLLVVYKNKDSKYSFKTVANIQVLGTQKEQVLTIKGWDRKLSWDKTWKVNDNIFLWGFDIRYRDWFLNLVNELNFEDYMRWIAEVPENELDAKRKVLQVLSRSYAYHYITEKKKLTFQWKHYNASDDPNVFQKYRGYWFTLRSPKWQKALKETEGVMLTYNDKVLRAAYYSCTWESGYTKTPEMVWWLDPYFKSVSEVYKSIKDSIWVDLTRAKAWTCGHWVWLSGYWATKMAEEGKTYVEILLHYYQNVSLKKIY